mmetsp:Transcript_44079/g.122602  ORF Transcript_44079/g.122602 Transcript_44079/m.122602 type:complete len:294 (-) Transcript_44079:131-1012(-)
MPAHPAGHQAGEADQGPARPARVQRSAPAAGFRGRVAHQPVLEFRHDACRLLFLRTALRRKHDHVPSGARRGGGPGLEGGHRGALWLGGGCNAVALQGHDRRQRLGLLLPDIRADGLVGNAVVVPLLRGVCPDLPHEHPHGSFRRARHAPGGARHRCAGQGAAPPRDRRCRRTAPDVPQDGRQPVGHRVCRGVPGLPLEPGYAVLLQSAGPGRRQRAGALRHALLHQQPRDRARGLRARLPADARQLHARRPGEDTHGDQTVAEGAQQEAGRHRRAAAAVIKADMSDGRRGKQ